MGKETTQAKMVYYSEYQKALMGPQFVLSNDLL